jgi:hypothetical protein
MPIENNAAVLVRQYLQNATLAYVSKLHVADRVFPIIDGLSTKTKVPKYLKGAWGRDSAEVRAPGTRPVSSKIKLSSHNLDPINYAFSSDVPNELARDSAIPGNFPFDPALTAVEFNAAMLDIKKEKRVSALLQATAWAGVAAPGTDAEGHWGDDTAASDTFLADIATGRDDIIKNTGYIPNKLFLDWPAWSDLQRAPALLALMNPTSLTREALVTAPALAALIGVEQIIIGAAVENTDEETVAGTEWTGSWIWGRAGANNAKGIGFLYYAPDSAQIMTPSAGYQYRVTGDSGAGRTSWTWYDDAAKTTWYATEENTDISATGVDCGYMWYDTATS